MKIYSLLLGLVLAFVSLASVEAYGLYGASSFPGYGYQESTDFYKNFNFNSFSGSSQFQQKNNQFNDLNELYQSSGTNGFSQSYLQDFLQDLDVNLNSGYSFTKGPCVSEVIHGNFHGKTNDFTITKEVCDNIEGTFFKNDQYKNSLNNGASVNNLNFGSNAYQNQYSNQNTYDNTYSQSASQQQQTLSASFGKGTRIVLN